MKITTVKYASLANLGNYENERIELEAEVSEEENWEEVLSELEQLVHSKLKNEEKYQQYISHYYEMQCKLEELSKKLHKRRQRRDVRWQKDRLVGDSDSPLIVDNSYEDCDGGLKPKGSDGNRATQPTTQPSASCLLPSAFLAKRDKAYDQWEETSNFLVAQGLKPYQTSFPIERQNLITAGQDETEVVEGELDEVIF